MYLNCKPPGGPRQFQLPYGVQFVEDPTVSAFSCCSAAAIGTTASSTSTAAGRKARSGRRRQSSLLRPVVANGKATRSSSIHDRFNEDFWFTNGGLPHTEQLKLTRTVHSTGSRHAEVRRNDRRPGGLHQTLVQRVDPAMGRRPGTPRAICQDNRP